MKRSSYFLALLTAFLWALLGLAWLRRPPVDHRAAERAVDMKIDINTASLDELCLLPGVGLTMASHILDLRQHLGGRFQSPDNLLATPLLGRIEFAKLRGRITCSPTTHPAE